MERKLRTRAHQARLGPGVLAGGSEQIYILSGYVYNRGIGGLMVRRSFILLSFRYLSGRPHVGKDGSTGRR